MSDRPLNKRQLGALRSKNVQKASNLLTRLEKYASGELTKNEYDDDGNVIQVPAEMTSGQLKAAEVFLKKTMPDLQSIDSTTTFKDERSGAEMREEGINFLMVAAGMSREQAELAMKKMAKEALN